MRTNHLTLITLDGSVLPAHLRTRRLMHNKQHIGSKPSALPLGGLNKVLPRGLRDSVPLFPLLDHPNGLTNFGSHFLEGHPDVEYVGERFEGLHEDTYTSDYLSGKGQTDVPLTEKRRQRTMSPMGRRVAPSKFKADFCARLKAARIMAGLTQAQLAEALGELPDTYRKYEKRTPLPHDLVPLACATLGITIDQLYSAKVLKDRKAA